MGREYDYKNEVVFEWRGVRCVATVRVDDYRGDWKSYAESHEKWMGYSNYTKLRDKKARLYYSEKGVTDLVLGKNPPYTIKGEDPENDKLWRAYNRAEMTLGRAAIEAVYPEFGKANFSRRAGCGCGCSPGFVSGTLRGVEGWIEVTLAEDVSVADSSALSINYTKDGALGITTDGWMVKRMAAGWLVTNADDVYVGSYDSKQAAEAAVLNRKDAS